MKFHSVLTPKTVFSVMFVVLLCFVQHSFAQNKMDTIAKQQVMSMLENVKNALKNDYYDPNPKFAGVDLETRFKAAEEKLKKTEYLPDAFAVIAQVVLDLNDSHTLFVPPNISTVVEYGWRVITVGEKSIVSGILENSDADKKGLKIGDEILAINGFRPTRKELWKVLEGTLLLQLNKSEDKAYSRCKKPRRRGPSAGDQYKIDTAQEKYQFVRHVRFQCRRPRKR
jgi:hypothetical protein